MTTDEALEHPYLSAYVCHILFLVLLKFVLISRKHDPEDEPTVTPLAPEYFEFDRKHDSDTW